jgi:cytochrome b6-f complex iron-sulfur subunit
MRKKPVTETREPSRRRFLRVVASAAALGAVAACANSTSGAPEVFGDASAGNVSDLPVGTLRALSDAPAYIGRDDGGLYAMTSTCTHEGCDMISSGSVDAAGVHCACHGSDFDANGVVTHGPAKTNLTHFAVDIDSSGNIVVHGGTTVAASTRTAAS